MFFLFLLGKSDTWCSIETVSGIVVFSDKGQCYEVLRKLIDVYNNTRAAFHTRQQLMGASGLTYIYYHMKERMKRICPCFPPSRIALTEIARETVFLPWLGTFSTRFFFLS